MGRIDMMVVRWSGEQEAKTRLSSWSAGEDCRRCNKCGSCLCIAYLHTLSSVKDDTFQGPMLM